MNHKGSEKVKRISLIGKGLFCFLLGLAIAGTTGFSSLPSAAEDQPATSEQCPKAEDLIQPDENAEKEIRDVLPQLIQEPMATIPVTKIMRSNESLPSRLPNLPPTPASPNNNAEKKLPENPCWWNCSSRSSSPAPACRKDKFSWPKRMRDGKSGIAIINTETALRQSVQGRFSLRLLLWFIILFLQMTEDLIQFLIDLASHYHHLFQAAHDGVNKLCKRYEK